MIPYDNKFIDNKGDNFMIRKNNEVTSANIENMRGGNGTVILNHCLNKDEFYDKGRLFSKIILNPSCSIGWHIHEKEMEAFFVIKGTADYDDNGVKTTIGKGDVTLIKSGEGHAVANKSDEVVEIMALIIFE